GMKHARWYQADCRGAIAWGRRPRRPGSHVRVTGSGGGVRSGRQRHGAAGTMPRELVITNDLTGSALAVFEAAMLASVRARGRFVVALAGGTTPLGAYRALADRHDLPWDATYVFWGDERFVPMNDPASNARAAREALLDHVPVPADQVFAWPTPDGEEDTTDAAGGADADIPRRDDDRVLLAKARAAAEAYAATLESVLGELPTFDLQLLGLGADGHTASLFPGDAAASAAAVALATRPYGVEHVRLSL